jgi:hypothetical protein
MTLIWIITALLPEFYDVNGWSLSIRPPTNGPYIVGETYEDVRVNITLINKTRNSRKCPPLELALQAAELEITLKYADGRNVRCHFEPFPVSRPEKWLTLDSGEFLKIDLRLTDFGYQHFLEPGKYRSQVRFKTPQGLVTSRQWVMEVVEPDAMTILASHTIPLDEHYAKAAPRDQYKAFIQQVKVGDQVYLLYRSFWGGVVRNDRAARCVRLAELPGKVEMKCIGEYGKGKELTITYADKTSPAGTTTILLDSRGEGGPYRVPPEDKSIPAPRPVKKP